VTISPKYRPRLVVMVKEPRLGRVKTRLGRGMGAVPATWWFRHQVTRLLRELDDPRWQVILAVSPDIAMHSRAWPSQLARIPQGRGDLGARMKRVLKTAGNGPVMIIGSDIPGITPAIIHAAFRQLGPKDMVFGPAKDGGFWLVGAKSGDRLPKDLFKNVRWSSAFALQDSLASLGDTSFGLAQPMQDIDNAADLRHSGSLHSGV